MLRGRFECVAFFSGVRFLQDMFQVAVGQNTKFLDMFEVLTTSLFF